MLLIAEKRAVMLEIENVYKKYYVKIPYDVTFACLAGHIVSTPLPGAHSKKQQRWVYDNLPIIPSGFLNWSFNSKSINPKDSPYEPTESGYKYLSEIEKILKTKHFDYICVATDPDLEGEVLFADQASLWDKKYQDIPRKRYYEDDTSPEKVIFEFNHLHDYNDLMINGKVTYNNWLNSSVLRQQVNYISGINLTRALSIKLQDLVRIGYSKGPILFLVCNRYLQHTNFKPESYWQLSATFDHQNGKYKGTLLNENNEKAIFKTLDEATTTAKKMENYPATIFEDKVKLKEVKAPNPFSGTELQSVVSHYGYSNNDIMASMESLSQTKHKFITYPRTDSIVFNDSQATEFPKMIKRCLEIPPLKKYAEIALKLDRFNKVCQDKTYFNSKKVSGHSAIGFKVTSNEKINWTSLSKLDQIVLYTIGKQLIQIALPPKILKNHTILTQIYPATFKSNCIEIKDRGWDIFKITKQQNNTLPNTKKGDQVQVLNLSPEERKTQPEPLFTNSSLMNSLGRIDAFLGNEFKKKLKVREFLGIGSPATRGTTIDEMLQNKTIKKTNKGDPNGNNKIIPTEKGLKIFKQTKQIKILKPEEVAKMELDLQHVQLGELSPQDFQKKYIDEVSSQIDYIKNAKMEIISPSEKKTNHELIGKCPCDGCDVIYNGKYYFCSNFKMEDHKIIGCHLFINPKLKFLAKGSITKTDVLQMLKKKHSSVKKLKSKDNKIFPGTFYLKEDGTLAFQIQSGKEVNVLCPICQQHLIIIYSSKTDEEYYICPQKTHFILEKKSYGHLWSLEELKNLINGDTLRNINFRWKNNRQGKADVRYNLEHKRIEFSFHKSNYYQNSTNITCPFCGSKIVKITNSSDNSSFYSCSNPKDKFTINSISNNHEWSESELTQLFNHKTLFQVRFEWRNGKIGSADVYFNFENRKIAYKF